MVGKQLWGGAHSLVCVKVTNNRKKLGLYHMAFEFAFEAAEFVLYARMPQRQIFIKNLAIVKFGFKEQVSNWFLC